MFRVLLKLDKFFLKYEVGRGVKLIPPSSQEKLPSKRPALLNDVKQQFFNEKDKLNLELVKSVKEQIDIPKKAK